MSPQEVAEAVENRQEFHVGMIKAVREGHLYIIYVMGEAAEIYEM